MTKLSNYLIRASFGLFMFCTGCGKESNEELNLPASLSIAEDLLLTENLSVYGGSVNLKIDWAHTKWTIKAGDTVSGEKFLSQINPSSGGAISTGISQTEVSISFGSNSTTIVNKQKLILSSLSGELSDTIVLTQSAMPIPQITVSIDPNTTYQTISGFGGANMIWGTDYLSSAEMELAFNTGENGLGLSLFRVRLPSNKNDWLDLVATVKEANQRGVKVLASPWSPPAVWKSNNSVNGGGYLLPEHYADFANYINEFIQFMNDQGAKIDVVSIQNEPDWKASYEGCEYTPTEMYNFVKNYAHLIKWAKVLAAESLNSNHTYTENILNDPNAAANLDLIGGHLYGSGLATYPLAEQKGKEIWMTEHLLNLDSGNHPENWTSSTSSKTIWNESMQMVQEIQTCMSYNWNAYIWWYIRRYYSFLGDGEKGTSREQILKRGYAMSQFSKFIRPGYQRIGTAMSSDSEILCTAYKGENKLVVVLINPLKKNAYNVTLAIPGQVSSCEAFTTSELLNREKTGFNQSDNHITVNIIPQSITTFILCL